MRWESWRRFVRPGNEVVLDVGWEVVLSYLDVPANTANEAWSLLSNGNSDILGCKLVTAFSLPLEIDDITGQSSVILTGSMGWFQLRC